MKSQLVAALLATTALLPAQTGEKKTTQDTVKKVAAKKTVKKVKNPKVLIKTSMGEITLELFANEAPRARRSSRTRRPGRRQRGTTSMV